MKIHQPDVRTWDYAVKAGGEVTMRVTIGNAQIGGWCATLGTKKLKGAGERVTLGKADRLKGNVMQVVVTVKDVRPETNRLGHIIRLEGGKKALECAQEIPVKDLGDGDLAIFTSLVWFA